MRARCRAIVRSKEDRPSSFRFKSHLRDCSSPPPYDADGTGWYRAPEMLLGKTDYDALVDTWSLGCVMAEMITGQRLFQVEEEVSLLKRIFQVVGVPDDTTWPEFASLPLAARVAQMPAEEQSTPRDLFPEETLSKEGFEVLNGLLACNPDKRLTATAALKLPWFATTAAAGSACLPSPAAAAAKIDTMTFSVKEEEVEIAASSTPCKRRIVATRSVPNKKAMLL